MVAAPKAYRRPVGETKRCPRCERWLPRGLDDWYPNPGGISGLCRRCHRAEKRLRRKRETARRLAAQRRTVRAEERQDVDAGRIKHCNVCGPRGLSAFSCETARPDGLANRCRDCWSAWRAASKLRAGISVCVCGGAKADTESTCSRCRFLDGETRTEQEVIMALRMLGGAAVIAAIVECLDGKTEESRYRNFYRAATPLVERGRLEKVTIEDADADRLETLYRLKGGG